MSFSWLRLRAKRPPSGGLFTLGTQLTRTSIYIDGYNLYYSRLKGTPYKWLDIVALFRDRIVLPQDPSAELVSIQYFTAPVKASYARHGKASEEAQTQYLRALRARYDGLIEVVQGFHIFEPTHLPAYRPDSAPSKDNVLPVWMIEEKQTDVNIALHAYRDAVRGHCDQLVICSNDSDMEPALRMIKDDAPHVRIGLVLPLRPKDDARARGAPNKRLTQRADWVRHYLRDDELAQSQLPTNVQTKKKPASKPAHW